MSRKLIDLKDTARIKASLAISELKRTGIDHAVVYTFRTQAEQIALYAQGREPLTVVNAKRKECGLYELIEKENSYTVTNCDGIRHKSMHQTGIAIDVVPVENGKAIWPKNSDPRWLQIANAFIKQGFTWGGSWKDFPDMPHYQLTVEV